MIWLELKFSLAVLNQLTKSIYLISNTKSGVTILLHMKVMLLMMIQFEFMELLGTNMIITTKLTNSQICNKLKTENGWIFMPLTIIRPIYKFLLILVKEILLMELIWQFPKDFIIMMHRIICISLLIYWSPII